MNLSRRSLFLGASAAFVAAPAIVRVAANLMPVSTRAQHFEFSTDQRYTLTFETSIDGKTWHRINSPAELVESAQENLLVWGTNFTRVTRPDEWTSGISVEVARPNTYAGRWSALNEILSPPKRA
jgi:hypothetical protein